MKNTLIAIKFCLIFISFLSCNKVLDESNQTGNIQFSIDNIILNNLKSTSTSAFVLVTIKDVNNNLIYSLQESELYEFEGNYISKPISLNPGEYKLSEFFVLDKNKEIIYASPLEGSKMAQLVDNPLEINFSVNKDATIKLTPEVIKVENKIPEDFGYVSFGFNTVETFDFLLSVFTYDTATENFELTDALLSIESPGTGKINTVSLGAETNNITTKDGFGSYILKLTKEGYADYIDTLACDSLKKHFNDPLEIILLENSLKDGLIAYYPFNGNANDESGNYQHSIAVKARLTTDRFGNNNSAFYFNKSYVDYISIPASKFALNQYSYSVWAKLNSLPTGVDSRFCVISIGNENHDSIQNRDQAITYNNNFVHPSGVFNGWGSHSYQDKKVPDSIYTSTTADLDKWYHLVTTKSSTTVSFYVNGELIDSVESIELPSYGTGPISAKIGARWNYTIPFDGKIDDVRIYNRPLTQEEITHLYNE